VSQTFVERECGVVEAGGGVDVDAEVLEESDCVENQLEICPWRSVLLESVVREESWSESLAENDLDSDLHGDDLDFDIPDWPCRAS